MYNKAGFTLVEVIVSVVVFGLVIVGLLGVFVAGNKHIIHTRERMTSAELGKFFLDPLQVYVRQDTWGPGNELAVNGTYTGTSQIINNRTFTETHAINGVPSTNLRRVTSTISWTEPSS